MGGVIAISILCFSSPLNAQADFFLPQNSPETKVTSVSSEIQNTGVGGATLNSASLNVMVWDGDNPGFAWDWEYGNKKGVQSLPSGIHDPDVVVANVSNPDSIFAHFVYEEGNDIFYEVWRYNVTANSWSQFVSPDKLSQGVHCSNPNIDRYGKKIAVVWSEDDHHVIMGNKGEINGNYFGSPEIVNSPNTSQGNFVEPDVAIKEEAIYGISVTFKEIGADSLMKKLRVATYDFQNFKENYKHLETVLETTYDDAVQFGVPRIAADPRDISNPWPFQIVMVRQNNNAYWVKGYNNYSGDNTGFDINKHFLNDNEYVSPFDGSIVAPADFPTKEPVVSFLEDIHVAWAYLEPSTDTWEIIYRRLEGHTGEPVSSNYYSLVNGYGDAGYFGYHQHHPCIASRFNYEKEKFIGWLDDEAFHPEYKIRDTNAKIFGLEEKINPALLYPNPAHNFFRINLPDEEEIQLTTVYSMDGRKVLESSTQSIDISELQQGVYIVEIKSGQKIRTKRLIKQ